MTPRRPRLPPRLYVAVCVILGSVVVTGLLAATLHALTWGEPARPLVVVCLFATVAVAMVVLLASIFGYFRRRVLATEAVLALRFPHSEVFSAVVNEHQRSVLRAGGSAIRVRLPDYLTFVAGVDDLSAWIGAKPRRLAAWARGTVAFEQGTVQTWARSEPAVAMRCGPAPADVLTFLPAVYRGPGLPKALTGMDLDALLGRLGDWASRA